MNDNDQAGIYEFIDVVFRLSLGSFSFLKATKKAHNALFKNIIFYSSLAIISPMS